MYLLNYLFSFLKHASSTLNVELMTGRRLELRLTTSRPMVTTLQLGTEDNLRVNKGTGGLEEPRTDPPKQLPLVTFKETDPKELLLPHTSPSRENKSHF